MMPDRATVSAVHWNSQRKYLVFRGRVEPPQARDYGGGMLAATSPANATVSVTVQPRGETVVGAPGALLLDTLRRAQIPISYSCEAGRCGTCRCEVLSGEVVEEPAEFRGLPAGL